MSNYTDNGKWGYKRLRIKGKSVLEHRYTMELHLGRKLSSHEHIHHIDGNKHNNSISNLLLTSNPTHASIHADKGKAMVEILCTYCGTKTMKEERNIKFKMKNGQTDFYCNRTCMAKHYGRHRSKGS